MADVVERYGWLGGLTGLLSLVIAIVLLDAQGGSNLFRTRGVPLLIALTAASWLTCLLGAGLVHRDRDNWVLWMGLGWAGFGLICWMLSLGGIWVADLLDIDLVQGDTGAWLISFGVGIGLIGIIAGLPLFGAGAISARVLPWWGRLTPILMIAILPAAFVIDVSRPIVLGVFVGGWVVLGVATRLTTPAAQPAP